MFDRLSVALPPSLHPWRRRTNSASALLAMGLAAALALSTSLSAASPVLALAPGAADTPGPSIQYQEAVAHAAHKYTFTPGGVVTVPYRPRPGDASVVDGAAPVALPAGRGAAASPQTAGSGAASPDTAITVLRREVLGFLPYWELGSTLDYNTLSTVAYFGIDLNTDGSLDEAGNGWNGWRGSTMTSVINNAHAHGTRVVLTVESFAWSSSGASSQTALLSSPSASLNAAQQIAAEVNGRGADGVDLDFEPIAPGQSANYVSFVRTLRAQLDALHPGYELTFCGTGAPGTYDLPDLLAPGAADAVFIMGYNLRGGTPAYTGSIDPLTTTTIRYSLTSVVNTYLSQVAPSKVILGLPWYGEAWSTGTSTALDAPPGDLTTYGQPVEVNYATAAGLAAENPATTSCQTGWPNPCVLGKFYDTGEQTAWTAYYGNYGGTQNTWRELYFDDSQALTARIAAIDNWNLRGVGIWALGYDNNNGDGDLTNTIAAQLEANETPSTYTALPPARILDTRIGTGLSGAFVSGSARTFQVAGVGGVPAGATAVTGNLTVTGQTSSGYLYVGPMPANSPTSSTLNFPVGDDRANGATVALGPGGTLSITYVAPTSGKTASVIFDVTGYFTPDMSGSTFVPLTPSRILDTRSGNGLSGPFICHSARTFQVTGRGGVPANATAVTGNLTVTSQTSLGYLYVGPTAMDNPTSSTLNFPLGDDRANNVTVALGTAGTLSITYVAPSPGKIAHVIFDVTGYFTPDSSGARFVPLTPSRVLDTRSGTELAGPFASHSARTFGVTGAGGVPSGATAVTGNLTVTAQTSLGYVYLGPIATNNPTSSTLNFPVSDDRANGVTVAIGPGGTLSATYVAPTAGKTTQLIFDVTGYFAP
jgi:spore germination protein YaaH